MLLFETLFSTRGDLRNNTETTSSKIIDSTLVNIQTAISSNQHQDYSDTMPLTNSTSDSSNLLLVGTPVHQVPGLTDLIAVLVECLTIMSLGYLSCRFKLISPESKDLGIYLSTFALPMIIFLNIARMEFQTINLSFLMCMLMAKLLLFITVTIFTLWISYPRNFSYAGALSILATQSNDFALGYPLVNSLYGETKPEILNYLSLMAPIQLLILNPLGLVMLEFEKSRQKTQTLAQRQLQQQQQQMNTSSNNGSNNDNNDGNNVIRDRGEQQKCQRCLSYDEENFATSTLNQQQTSSDGAEASRTKNERDDLSSGCSDVSKRQHQQLRQRQTRSRHQSIIEDDLLISVASNAGFEDTPVDKRGNLLHANGQLIGCLHPSVMGKKDLDTLNLPHAAWISDCQTNYGFIMQQQSIGFNLKAASLHTCSTSQESIVDSLADCANCVVADRDEMSRHYDRHATNNSNNGSQALDLGFIKALATNPLIIASIVALVVNLTHGPTLPKFVTKVSNTIAASFAGPALFVVGVSMYGKFELLSRNPSDLLLASILVLSKVLILPSLMRTATLLVLPNFVQNDEIPTLTDFSYLYGLLPAAPGACIIAKQYGVLDNVVSISMLLSTFISAPLMLSASYIINESSNQTTGAMIDFASIMSVLKQTLRVSSVMTLTLSLLTIYTLLKIDKRMITYIRRNSASIIGDVTAAATNALSGNNNPIARDSSEHRTTTAATAAAPLETISSIDATASGSATTTTNENYESTITIQVEPRSSVTNAHTMPTPTATATMRRQAQNIYNGGDQMRVTHLFALLLAITQLVVGLGGSLWLFMDYGSDQSMADHNKDANLYRPTLKIWHSGDATLAARIACSLQYIFSSTGILMARFVVLSMVVTTFAFRFYGYHSANKVLSLMFKVFILLGISMIVCLVLESGHSHCSPTEASLPSWPISLNLRLVYNLVILVLAVPLLAATFRRENKTTHLLRKATANTDSSESVINSDSIRSMTDNKAFAPINLEDERQSVNSNPSLSSATTANTNLDLSASSGANRPPPTIRDRSSNASAATNIVTETIVTLDCSTLEQLITQNHTDINSNIPKGIQDYRNDLLILDDANQMVNHHDVINRHDTRRSSIRSDLSITVESGENLRNTGPNFGVRFSDSAQQQQQSTISEGTHAMTNGPDAYSGPRLTDHQSDSASSPTPAGFNRYSILIVFMLIQLVLNITSIIQVLIQDKPMGTLIQVEITSVALDFGQGLLTFLVIGTQKFPAYLISSGMTLISKSPVV